MFIRPNSIDNDNNVRLDFFARVRTRGPHNCVSFRLCLPIRLQTKTKLKTINI